MRKTFDLNPDVNSGEKLIIEYVKDENYLSMETACYGLHSTTLGIHLDEEGLKRFKIWVNSL